MEMIDRKLSYLTQKTGNGNPGVNRKYTCLLETQLSFASQGDLHDLFWKRSHFDDRAIRDQQRDRGHVNGICFCEKLVFLNLDYHVLAKSFVMKKSNM